MFENNGHIHIALGQGQAIPLSQNIFFQFGLLLQIFPFKILCNIFSPFKHIKHIGVSLLYAHL